jgi:hypothetical protein
MTIMKTIEALVVAGITILILELIANTIFNELFIKKFKKKNMLILYDEHSNKIFLYNEKTGEKTRIN